MAVWKQIWARTVDPRSLETVSHLARCCCTHEQGLRNCFPMLQETQSLPLAWQPWRLRWDRRGSAGSYLRPASKSWQSKAGDLSAFGFAVLVGEPPDDPVRCGLHLGGAVRWSHILLAAITDLYLHLRPGNTSGTHTTNYVTLWYVSEKFFFYYLNNLGPSCVYYSLPRCQNRRAKKAKSNPV